MTNILSISNNPGQSLRYAISKATLEGWNPGLDDAQTFAYSDPSGFFLGSINARPIACGSSVCYDDHFAFLGLYIVDPLYRGKGHGMQIWQYLLDYAGDRCIGLDGVLENEYLYEKDGFKTDHISERYLINTEALAVAPKDERIQPITAKDINLLNAYDQLCFPANRQSFLQAWVTAPHALSFSYKDVKGIRGYIVIRACINGYKVGPLFADNISYAKLLLDHALAKTSGKQVTIDVPSNHKQALDLIKTYQTTVSFACNRMYRNGKPIFDTQRVYGISTFELG